MAEKNARENVSRGPAVHVVDDDAQSRGSLETLMKSINLPVRAFASAGGFLRSLRAEWRGCVVVDVRMPGMNGMELQQELKRRGVTMPLIFVTAYVETAMVVDAMKAGAFYFFEKPCSPQALLDQVQAALEVERVAGQSRSAEQELNARLDSLSPREREIMDRMVDGATTKEIAYDLKIGETTVDYHRRHVFEKMAVDNVVKLVKRVVRR